ncbi:MAG: bifunctional phosphopantothenoylcysteine decarboxylase/phosphopantothenate--cysteine ligase CoaBC [Candidatus Diapherotrites archaeon]|nr:bifunctional phosphopantothenoylcysteine decarboxylase/phosphopantothenate--cysteine ligase CoaBC [Candidatus Diapherotrites archaeon]
MHPALDISGTRSQDLAGKHIAVGLCGSLSLYRSLDLMRELLREGAQVTCLMSPAAAGMISPALVEGLTGSKPITQITGALEHVQLFGSNGSAALLLIAPATASSISKIACGMDDSPITSCALCALGTKPILIVPAMHEPMERNPAVQENIQKLKSFGVEFVEPVHAEGKAKFAEQAEIILHVKRLLSRQPLKDKKILILNGPSAEPIDSVRVITNHSSGKTGNELAKACFIRGAAVFMVSSAERPFNEMPFFPARTLSEFAEQAFSVLQKNKFDAVFVPAALGDFEVKQAKEKISSVQKLSLELTPAPKLIAQIRKKFPKLFICSFKAETQKTEKELMALGKKILAEQGMNAVVLSDVLRHPMGADESEMVLVTKEKTVKLKGIKSEVAGQLVEQLASSV